MRRRKSRNNSKSRRLAAIKETLPKVKSLEELCDAVNLKPSTIGKYRERYDLDLEHLAPYRTKPELDAMIDSVAGLGEMSRATDRSVQYVRLYLRDSNQERTWKRRRIELICALRQAKREARERKRLFLEFDLLLNAYLHKRAMTESWPYQMSAKYFEARPHATYPFEQIVRFFEHYEHAKAAKEKLSLAKLGAPVGISAAHASVILSAVGFPPLCWKTKRRALVRPDQEEAIRRAFYTQLAPKDVEHFIGVEAHVVSRRFKAIGEHHSGYVAEHNGTKISYRLGSMILQQFDAGKNEEQIVGDIGIDKYAVLLAADKEESIRRKVISALRTLFNRRMLSTPYL